eukprot:gene102-4351_t
MENELKKSKKTVLPVEGERNVLITSALPYVNNVPHLGNIIGAVLSADVYARYCKQRGYNAIYICGTDEYGTATETKALKEGLTPQEICDKYHKIHAEIYEWFDVDFDHFGRTSTEWQTKIAQDIFLNLYKNGYMEEGSLDQLFCETCQRYLADRYVRGTCPNCEYDDAAGDQCDKCGKLLNPSELVKPHCSVCLKTPIPKTTNHIFLNLPKLEKQIEEWKNESIKSNGWTNIAIDITESWIKDGLKQRCITRDLKWGTPVPLESHKEKVFYVWFDAPIGYVSITANYTNEWEKWWKNPKNVELVQFMGKDNVPFHSIIFPGSLLGTGQDWTKVNKLSSTAYLNYEEGKFSKTRGTGIFGDHAKDTGIEAEVFRYYLLVNRPETGDSEFNWFDFGEKNNTELLNNLGNFVNRALKFASSNFEGKVPKDEIGDAEMDVIKKIDLLMKEYINALENIKLKEGLKIVLKISSLGNLYLQEQKPWDIIKTDVKRCGAVVNFAIQVSYLLATIAEPYLPGFSTKLLGQINFKPEVNKIQDKFDYTIIKEGHQIGTVAPIFKKLQTKELEGFREKYGAKTFDSNLIVGKIIKVEEVENSDTLFKFQVDIGENKPKQVLAGIKKFYQSSDLQDLSVIVVANLKVTKIGGETSEGMILTAGDKKRKKIVLLSAPKESKPGDSIYPKEYPTIPSQAILSKSLLDKILKKFKIEENGEISYKTHFLVNSGKNSVFVDKSKIEKGFEIK